MSRPPRVTDRASRSSSRHAGAPARESLDAREQLGERKRLGQVVVTARLQPADPVVHGAERAQHQHRRSDSLLAHELDDGQPVDVRQHPIGDHEVELPLGGAKQSFTPVRGMIDRVTALPQALDEKRRGLGIVLDEQDVHGPQD